MLDQTVAQRNYLCRTVNDNNNTIIDTIVQVIEK